MFDFEGRKQALELVPGLPAQRLSAERVAQFEADASLTLILDRSNGRNYERITKTEAEKLLDFMIEVLR